MSVSSTGTFRVRPTAGPPELVASKVTVTGDASAGVAQCIASLDDSYLWVIVSVGFRQSAGGPAEVEFQIHNVSNVFVDEDLFQSVLTDAVPSFGASTVWLPPPVIVDPVGNSTVALSVINSLNNIVTMIVEALRWGRNDPIPAWLVAMISPNR